mgnify:CR=1 FL=1
MNIEIVKSLTHRLCRMFGHFYGELWTLEENKIEVMQLLKDLIKSGSDQKSELSTWLLGGSDRNWWAGRARAGSPCVPTIMVQMKI